MGRSWQFFLVVAVTIAVMAVLYYQSDFYAKHSAGLPTKAPIVIQEGSSTAPAAGAPATAGTPTPQAAPGAPAAPAPAPDNGGGILPTNE